MTTLAYLTPVSNAGHGPPMLRQVPTELVDDAPTRWYQPQPDGSMRTYLVTERDPPDPDQATPVELWRITARQGNAIEDIGERRLLPEAVDNEAFQRTGYSMDIADYIASPSDGSSFNLSLDYFRSYSEDDW